MSTQIFNELIKKTSDYDKDERYMATNDIINNLSKDVKIDEILEKKICSAILKQLDDKSNDVQSVAVKCLALLVRKVHIAQLVDICDKLCSLILEGPDALRDIYSIGLKTLISDTAEEHGSTITPRLVPRLVFGISRIPNDDIIKESLDNLNDLIRRFGRLIGDDHDEIMKSIILQLFHEKTLIRKKAAMTLGSLTVVLTETSLNKLVETLIGHADVTSRGKLLDKRTLIQTFGAIARSVGYRLGRHLDRLIPLFLNACGNPDNESEQTEAANELREYAFPGLEAFVLRCHKEVAPYLNDVIKTALRFIKYDPNYVYEDNSNDMEQDEEYFEDEDEYAGSDDDDGSWKVRKAAIKVIIAAIISRPELLSIMYDQFADLFISRFKDREETVRLDIISALTLLIRNTATVYGISQRSETSTTKSPRGNTLQGTVKSSRITSLDLVDKEELLKKVRSRFPQIVQSCKPHFESPSVKTKSALFSLLKSVVSISQSGLENYLDLLINWVERSLVDKNQSLKLDSLGFLRSLIDRLDRSSTFPYISRLLSIASIASKDDWYKIIAEALRVFDSIILVIRPLTSTMDNDMETNLNDQDHCIIDPSIPSAIFDAVFIRFDAVDIDQEIKECSILTIGKLFSHLGDQLSSQLPVVLTILRKRLDNEVSRHSALKAILDMSCSPLQLDVSSFIIESIRDVSLFLRQSSRRLRLLTLQTIDSLLSSASAKKDSMIDLPLTAILKELSPLISDADLPLTHSALKVVLTIINHYPQSIDAILSELYGRLTTIAASSMIQGAAFESLVNVYEALSLSNHSALTHQVLFNDLYVNNTYLSSSSSIHRQSMLNIAKCIAGITLSSDQNIQNQTIDQFIRDLQSNDRTHSAKKQLTLFCLGEVGYHSKNEKYIVAKDLIVDSFESDIEEIRGAAAYALGHLAMGAMDVFLPIVLDSVRATNSRNQYLLLTSLREIIYLHVMEGRSFQQYLSSVLPGLESLFTASDDGLRNIVAECIGLLTVLDSAMLLPWLQAMVIQGEQSKLIKWTLTIAFRHTLSRPLTIDSTGWKTIQMAIKPFLEAFFRDDDLEVRKGSLQLVNGAIHHNPLVVAPYLADLILPKLFEAIQCRLEKIVDLGPFKHKVDEALPLRKVALTAIDTILDTYPERMDYSSFMPLIVPLLTDTDDVKIQAHQVLIKVSKLAPLVVSNTADIFIEPLEKTVTKKPPVSKEDAPVSGAEVDRALDLIRSGVRVVSHITKIPEIESNPLWQGFVDRLTKTGIALVDTGA